MGKRRRKKNKNKNNNMKKFQGISLHVVGGDLNYANWLPGVQLVDSIYQADVVMFTGGSDVDPALYDEEIGMHTYINKDRDKKEIEIFNEAVALDKKLIGICRGSQFLTVMAGGKLIQHVDNHAIHGTHSITWNNNEKSDITSTHHQMHFPFNLPNNEYVICAYSTEKRSNVYLNGDNEQIVLPKEFVECEVVAYPKINALAIQGHPEMMRQYHPGIKAMQDIVKVFLNTHYPTVENEEKMFNFEYEEV